MSGGQVFLLPDLGEGLTEAEIVQWRVAVGDLVQVDQVVVEVETAKAAVEVPCPYAGTVDALHAAEGEALPVGEPLLTIRANRADSTDGADSTSAAGIYREEEQAGSGNVLIGYGTSAGPNVPRRRRGATRRSGADSRASLPEPITPPQARSSPMDGSPLVISPLVRRLARQHGLDLRHVVSTGPGGIVLRRDVDAAVAGRTTASGPPPVVQGSDGPLDVRIPLRGLRRAVADKLTTSRREIPDVSIWVDVDATGLLEARDALRSGGAPVSLLSLLARINLLALRKYPALNSRVDTAAHEIVQHAAVHLGIAVQADRGLVVPVVRDAGTLTLRDLDRAISDAVARARAGTLSPAELTGGTFTLNNYGVFGIDGSTPIINHPEAAIVGIGRIIGRPWAVDGRLELRQVTQLVLAFDHRVCDGGTAGGFLRQVADWVESPQRLLAEL